MRKQVRRTVAALAIALAIVTLGLMVAARRTPTTATKSSFTSKTPWGEPDLQGIWMKDSDIPLERPAKYADREFFADQERADIDKKISDILARESTEARRKRGSEKDVTGAYNAGVFSSHLPTGRRTSLIVDPPNGKIPPVTPTAQKRRVEIRAFQLALLQATAICKNHERGCAGGKYAPTPSPRLAETPPYYLSGSAAGVMNRADGPEDRSVSERCLSATLLNFGAIRRIVQSPGGITILREGSGPRNIIMNGGPHLPANVRQWEGDSRGHWEGNTLVVDVTNFSPKSEFQGAHENLHLVERWTRLNADTLEYAVTIEDPTVWTRPWTVKEELRKQSDEANRIYLEPRCQEGNYGLPALLRGAREEEAAFAQGRGPHPATLCIYDADCGGFASGFADEGEDSNPLRPGNSGGIAQ